MVMFCFQYKKTIQNHPKTTQKPIQITNNKNHINSIHSTLLKNPQSTYQNGIRNIEWRTRKHFK